MNQEYNTDELKKQFLLRDRLINIISKDGKLRVSFIKNSKTSIDAQQKHVLDYISATYLAQLLAANSMIASFLKGEERISIDISSNNYLKRLYSESNQVGEVRGYAIVNNDIQIDNLTSLDDILSDGFLSVTRILYNNNEPTKGIIEVKSQTIDKILEDYFTQSEQIPSKLILDILSDDDGNIIHSGGILIQALPGADMKEVMELYNYVLSKEKITDYFIIEKSLTELLDIFIPFEYDVIKNRQIDFFCRCTKDRFVNTLRSLSLFDIKEMRQLNQNELRCHYCNNAYFIEEIDFQNLIDEKQAELN